MNYRNALARLEAFRELVERHDKTKYQSDDDARAMAKRVYEAYGQIEDVVELFVPKRQINVPGVSGTHNVYPNYIEAGYLSGRTFHSHEGYTELLKVIGRVKRLIEDPTSSRDELSVTSTVKVLRRLRECCQYVAEAPANERAIQDIVWIMLRSHYDRLDREESLSRFGVKRYIPDFGIPDLKLLIEVKFIGPATSPGQIQEEITADIPAYLADQSRYAGIVVLVYDAAHKLRDARKFVEDLRSIEGMVDVVVVPGIG